MATGLRACRQPLTSPLARRRALADPCALAQPDRARPQHAAQLARSRQVHPVTGAQREVLVITGHAADRARATALQALGQASANALARTGDREPVVGVWPGSGLRWVAARRANPLGQLSQLVPAPLPDGCERHRVPGEAERDFVGPAGAITAAHRLDRQHGAIDAT
jgi:hypothetical protein